MNIITSVTIILLGVFSIIGYKKGLMKTVISFACIAVSLLLANAIYAPVSKSIRVMTHIDRNIEQSVSKTVTRHLDSHVNSQAEQILAIEKLPIPEDMQKLLIDNNNSDVYAELAVTTFSDYIGKLLSCIIVNGIAYLVTFAILYIFFRVLIMMANILTDFPLVGWIDSLGGLALGFLKGLILVWVVYFFVTMCSSTSWGGLACRQIAATPWMKTIYDNNLLTQVLYNLTKTLF